MATNYALRVNFTSAAATQVTVGSAVSTYTSFGTPTPTRIWMKADTDTYVRSYTATGTGPVTAGVSMYLTSGVDYVLDIPPQTTRFRCVRKSGTGTLRFLRVA